MSLRRRINKLFPNIILHIGQLSAANFINRALIALSLLIAVKLYSQESIGIYSTFMAYAAILSVVSLLSLHLSLPGISQEFELQVFVWVLLAFTFVLTIAFGIGFWIIGYLYSAILAAFVGLRALLLIAEQVCIRDQQFLLIVALRIVPPVTFFIALWLFSLTGYRDASGLILSQLLSSIAGSFVAIRVLAKYLKIFMIREISFSVIKRLLSKNKDFAIFITLSQLFNTLSYNLPTILIDKYLGPSTTAQYTLALRLSFLPLNMISNAIGQVLHSRLAYFYRSSTKNVGKKIQAFHKGLGFLGLLTVFGTFFVLAPLSSWILGPQWTLTSSIIKHYAFLYGGMIIVAPLGVSFYVLGRRVYLMLSQFAYFMISLLAFGYAAYTKDLLTGIRMFVILGMIRYAVTYKIIWDLQKAYFAKIGDG